MPGAVLASTVMLGISFSPHKSHDVDGTINTPIVFF